MSLMSEERRKEMEDEMSRFESEISGPEEPPRMFQPRMMHPRPPPLQMMPHIMRPPMRAPMMPRMRFIPHQLHRGPRMMEPYPPPMFPPRFCHNPPPQENIMHRPQTAVVASAAPTIYAAPFVKSTVEEKPAVEVKAEPVRSAAAPVTTVTTSATEENNPQFASATPTPTPPHASKKKKKKIVRMAGGQAWEDNSLLDWENDDFRIFCGDLGNDVTDEVLIRAFSKYPSFVKAKVIRDKRTNKTKGFGFVSFKDPADFIRAMREMNGRYVGSRPIKLRKSSWKDRNIDVVKKKQKEKEKLGLL